MPEFTYRSTLLGSPIQHAKDLGSRSNTSGTATSILYISHDSTTPLRGVRYYLRPRSGAYHGLYGASFDFLNVLNWGTNSTAGIFFNQDTASTAAGSDVRCHWNGSTGTGDVASRGVPLAAAAVTGGGSTSTGHWPVGATAILILKYAVPVTETAAGLRNFELGIAHD